MVKNSKFFTPKLGHNIRMSTSIISIQHCTEALLLKKYLSSLGHLPDAKSIKMKERLRNCVENNDLAKGELIDIWTKSCYNCCLLESCVL